MKKKQQTLLGCFIKDTKGDVLVETIVKLLVVVCLLVTVINTTGIFVKYQNLSHLTKSLVRTIELEGQVNSQATATFNRLNTSYNLGATYEIADITYFDYITKKIQLRNNFTITAKAQYNFNILTPAFGKPLAIKIPLKVQITGMSEVYWK